MKKKKILWLVLGISILFSCSNNKPAGNTGESTVTPPIQGGSPKVIAPGNTFYTLKLDSASLATLLADNTTKKLIVQFTYKSSTDTALSLVAYGAKTNNVKTTGPIALVPLSNPVTNYPAPVILGDQELSLKSIKNVLGMNGSGPINASKLRAFQLVPLKDGSNHIYYAVTKLGMTEADGAALTNPSPPAPPCENGCDF